MLTGVVDNSVLMVGVSSCAPFPSSALLNRATASADVNADGKLVFKLTKGPVDVSQLKCRSAVLAQQRQESGGWNTHLWFPNDPLPAVPRHSSADRVRPLSGSLRQQQQQQQQLQQLQQLQKAQRVLQRSQPSAPRDEEPSRAPSQDASDDIGTEEAMMLLSLRSLSEEGLPSAPSPSVGVDPDVGHSEPEVVISRITGKPKRKYTKRAHSGR
jgi:hypothetical protein